MQPIQWINCVDSIPIQQNFLKFDVCYIIQYTLSLWICYIFLDKYCFRSCENTKAPQVCGSDGKWYKSECALKKLNCDNLNGTKLKIVNNTICEKSKLSRWFLTDR